MECLDLDELVARLVPEPAGEAAVQLGTRCLREAAVGDLADEHVPELVRLLAADRRPRLPHDQVAQEQTVERDTDALDVRRELGERTRHEHAAHRRRPLEHGALGTRQPIDASADERLDRVGDALGALVRALREHADRLLDEQRIPLRLREHGLDVDRQLELCGEHLEELGALGRLQRLELERRRAHTAAAPGGTDVEQLRARDAEDQQRLLSHPRREVLDQLQHRLLAPVHVLEHEHERLRSGELLRPRACRPRDLLLAALSLDRLEHADGEREQVGDRLVLARLAKLLLRLVERVVLGDAGRCLHHLGERPVRDTFAVGQAASRQHNGAVEPGGELAREPALPDTRVAVDGDEGCALVAHGPLERVLEQLELGVAADERRGRPSSAAHTARWTRTGASKPRNSTGASGSSSIRSWTRRAVPGPMRISPGCAACWRRAARFTGSPVAKVDSRWSSETTSPDSIPIRAFMSSSRTLLRVAKPARTARSASSSCASGIPKAAMTASPANFSTVPPCVTMQCATSSKNLVTWRRTTSGSRPARRSVESTRSTNSTVASLRSTSTWYVDGIWLGSPRMLDPTVFKAYDVRGLYPSQLDEEGAYAIGRAVVEQFEPKRFAVGRDMRVSSLTMAEAAIRGAVDAGAEVLDLGDR